MLKKILLSVTITLPTIAILTLGPAYAENAGVAGTSTSISNTSIEYRGTGPSANVRYLYKRGVVNFEQGDLLTAKRVFAEILISEPRDASTNFYMARIKSQQNDHKGALKHYQIVLDQYPKSYGVVAGMGQIYVETNQYGDAYRLLDTLVADAKVCANTCQNAQVINEAIAIVSRALVNEY